MPKVNICALDQECVQKIQHYIGHRCLPIHHKQKNKPCFKSLVLFFNNILPILHPFNMFIIIVFCLCSLELVKIWNLNTFFQKCSYVHDCVSSFCYSFHFTLLHLHRPSLCFYHCLHLCGLLFSHLHLCGWMYFRFNNVFLPSFVYTIYASTKCCSITSSSFVSSMNIVSIDVAHGPIYSFACQLFLLLRKKLNCICSSFIHHELSFAQITSSHYMFSLLHFPKMMMNGTL